MPPSIAERISGLSLSASKSPSGPMPMVANRARMSCSAGSTGANRSTKLRMLEELRRRLLLVGRQRRHEVDGRGRRGAGWFEEHRQRLHLVAGLDLLDVVEVGRAQQLGAVEHDGQVGVASG